MTTPAGSSKRVLMVAYSYYESDPRVIREAEAARDGGFEVDFLALRKPGSAPVELLRGVRVVRINQEKYRGGGRMQYLLAYLLFFWECFLKGTYLFFTRRYRIIHVNNMPDFLVFSTIIPRLFGAKVILDIHDPMPNTFSSKFKGGEHGLYYWLLLWQERLSAAYSSRVITVHEPVKHSILVKHGLAPDSIGVIANFADQELFRLREPFAVGPKIRLVFHGTILERSGLRLLVHAVAKVRRKDKLALTIIGEGDFSQALEELIHSLGLDAVIDFDNRSYPVHAIPERIAECSVGLVPLEISSVTNFALPLKLLEYISLGLPVVCVRNEAIGYYFNEDDCMFFDSDDPNSLTAVLDRIAEDSECLLRYRERAVALRSRFAWSGEKQKYVTLLRDLAGVS